MKNLKMGKYYVCTHIIGLETTLSMLLGREMVIATNFFICWRYRVSIIVRYNNIKKQLPLRPTAVLFVTLLLLLSSSSSSWYSVNKKTVVWPSFPRFHSSCSVVDEILIMVLASGHLPPFAYLLDGTHQWSTYLIVFIQF